MNMTMRKKTLLKKERGIVLLEGLIAILIFSFGVLALVGLQAASIKNVTEAKYRSDAAFFANQVVARMWVSDKATLETDFETGGAAYDAWLAEVQDAARGLPGSTANAPTIDVEPANNMVTVTVFWVSPSDPDQLVHRHVAVTQIN
ncbi:MAG: type IV pilus modification PilV family protein [Burkholderiales bacterium]